ncbi:22991_t:CDS:2 [Rhizophagus irregularis]|nr:22991_t:CDS:2 [Rhizophagus irregularis]
MKERHVVTSFLVYTEGIEENSQGDNILLLKRSDKVRTYKNHWAGISGGIEENDSSPLERALKEIQEETSLSHTDITLIRSGKLLTILGKNEQTIWKVYPFLFHINTTILINKIQINWEHQTYEWIKPTELNNYECVPNLLETLYRVYLPTHVHKGLNDMFKDRNSGAQELSKKSLDILKETIINKEFRKISKNSKELWKNLLNVGWYLKEIRPNMKASISFGITNVLKKSKEILQDKEGIDIEEYENNIINIIEQMKTSYKENDKKIKENFLKALFPSLNEEKSKQEEDIHIMTMIITDASCNYFMPTVTHVLIGADHISGNNGDIINKIGSMSLILSAKHFNKSVYIITTSNKISSPFEEKIEENESKELTKSYGNEWINNIKGKNVLIRNIYFEKVETKFIDGYIMEINEEENKSIINTNKIKELWNQRKEDERIFEELEVNN